MCFCLGCSFLVNFHLIEIVGNIYAINVYYRSLIVLLRSVTTLGVGVHHPFDVPIHTSMTVLL